MKSQSAEAKQAHSGPNQASASGTFAPPSVSLPKGGGAIRGIGEKFGANSCDRHGLHGGAGRHVSRPLPPPTGKLTFHFNDNSMEDLWSALTWRNEE